MKWGLGLVVRLTLLIFFTCAKAAAQSTPSAEPGSGLLNRVSYLGESVLDKLTFSGDRGVLAIYPAGGFSPSTGVEFGLMPVYSWNNGICTRRVNTLSGSLQFSSKGMVYLKPELEWFPGNGWQLQGHVGYTRLSQRYHGLFYGTNGDAGGIRFLSSTIESGLTLFRHLYGNFHGGIKIEGNRHLFTGWESSLAMPAGEMIHGINTRGLGPVLMFDSRDHLYFTTAGIYMLLGYLDFGYRAGGTTRYARYMADFRKFVAAGSRVVAFQVLWEYSQGNDVPFFVMPRLGGKDGLRGIEHSLRVVNKGMALARVETRSPLWWRLGTVLFAEAGYSGPTPVPGVNGLIGSFGLGLRFRILPAEPLNIRFDAALSTIGSHGFFITLGEVF